MVLHEVRRMMTARNRARLVIASAVGLVVSLPAVAAPQQAELHVAAAANLSHVLVDLSSAFEHRTGIRVVPSFGATAQLEQQIENGAPVGVFLAADVEHVDELIKGGFAEPSTRAIYARGQLVVWAPRHPELSSLAGLENASVRVIAVAKPALAPYGAAAVETLHHARLWDKLKDRVVYAPSVSVAKEFADTGNADAAFTASSLTATETGHSFPVDESLHKPIEQALCIVRNSKEQSGARSFTAFLASPEARAILKRYGYL